MDDTLLTRLAGVDSTSLIDAAPTLRVLPLTIRPLVPGRKVVGPVVTASAHRDLMSFIAGLAAAGPGDVLVVDAGGHDRAVAGELFSTEAQRRGLAGLVIHGRCRDSRTLATMTLPVFATGVSPHAYAAARVPDVGSALSLEGVVVNPGDLLVGDDDGLVVGSVEEMEAAIDGAEAIQVREEGLRSAMESGTSLFDLSNYDEHVAALTEGRASRLSLG